MLYERMAVQVAKGQYQNASEGAYPGAANRIVIEDSAIVQNPQLPCNKAILLYVHG